MCIRDRAELPSGEQVDLSGLLRHQGRRPLGEDGDAGHQLERCAGGKVAKEDERLVELGVDVVWTGPALVDGGISPKYMVVGNDVAIAHLIDPLSIGADTANVRDDLSLGKNYSDVHGARRPIMRLR